MAAAFEGGSKCRAVLAAIVADPVSGPSALSHPATLFSLLTEYLPDSPDETRSLLAAAQVDIPETLRRHVADGKSSPMAIQLASTRLAARTDLPDQACLWAASEFALALGLAATDELQGLLFDGDVTEAPAEPPLVAGTGAEPPSASGGPRQRGSRRPRSGRPPGPRSWLAAIAGPVVVAGVIGVALFSQRHVAGPQPYRSDSHGNPGTRTASARPSNASSRHVSGTAHRSVRAAASPRPSPAGPAPAGPVPVARAFVADVNEHDWPSLWQLGGGNVVLTYQPNPAPQTYAEMVAAFRYTVSVKITSLTSVGDTVSMRVSAVDSAGVTQYYELNLVIGRGRVVSGSQYFLGP